NIITKRGEGPLTARVEVGFGSDGRQEGNLALSGGYNIFDFAFAFSRSSRDDMHVAMANTGAERIATKGSSKWNGTAFKSKYGIDGEMGLTFMDNHRIGFHIAYTDIDNGHVPGGGFISTAPYPLNYSNNNNYTYNYTLSYDGKTSDDRFNWFLKYTRGQILNQAAGYSDPTDPNAYPPYFPEISWTSKSITVLDQIQAQFTFDSLSYVTVTAGVDYFKYKTETWGYSATKGSIADLAFYVLGKVRLFDSRLIFTVGGRYDSYKLTSITAASMTANNFVPSVGLAFSPYDFIKFRANYSVGYALPNTQQFLGDGGVNYLAAPNLKPQESKTYELGVDISYDYIDASLTYFHSNFKNKFVSFVVPGECSNYYKTCNQFQNLAGSVYAGIELILKFDIARAMNQEFSLTPFVNLTMMTKRENKDQRVGAVVPIAPNIMPNVPKIVLSYGITFDYPDINLSANLNASYFGKVYTQDFDTNPLAYLTGGFPWMEYGGFTTVNFSISKRILDFQDKGNLGIKVDVNNIFNEYKGPTMNYPIQARNFYVGLVYSY
ncbi:MAG: TonB-dependent receptor, partial [Endomicrobium sp.]|nr:TonB-dependent receptor [Endomicrobium sp.]